MKVSIVIPTYKRPDYLDRLLKSIQQQTFKSFEIIVVDDNSPNIDEYKLIVEKYQKIFDEFTFITKKENKGAPNSRNIGIKKAKYNLIALVDDDDEWLPKKLEKQVEVFKNSDEDVGLVYTWTDAIDENGNVVYSNKSTYEGYVFKEILLNCFIISASVMVRKKAIIEARLFDETFPSCQDWDMWTRILQKYKCKVVKETLTLYHKHSNESIGLSKEAINGFLKYHRKYFAISFRTLPLNNFIKYLKKFLYFIKRKYFEKN